MGNRLKILFSHSDNWRLITVDYIVYRYFSYIIIFNLKSLPTGVIITIPDIFFKTAMIFSFQTWLWVNELFKRMPFTTGLPPFILTFMGTTAVVKSHFWPKIPSTTSQKELKTKTIPLTFNSRPFPCIGADNFHCVSPRSETYYTNFPANCRIPLVCFAQ